MTKKIAIMAFGLLASLTMQAQTSSTDSTKLSKLEETQQLREVVVKSTLPKIRNNANGMMCIIAGSELEKVGNTKDLLRRLPGIQKADDAIEVYGRGAADVYVNNRKVYDMKELERISSDQIVNVEIISNPGARYAASTKAVIRIKTKRPQGEGWGFREEIKGFHYVGWGAREQLDVNYRHGGLDISASITGETKNEGATAYERIETYSDGKRLQQVIDRMHNRTHERSFSPGVKVNYTFGEDQSVGAQYHYFREPYAKTHTDLPSLFTYDGSFLQNTMSYLDFRTPYYNHQANAYYSGKVKQWQIDFNLDGFWSNTKSTTITEEVNVGQNASDKKTLGDDASSSKINTAFNHNTNRLYTGKLVVEHPLLGGTLGFGGEYNNTYRSELNVNPATKDGNTNVKEQIWSGFVEYRRMFWNKLRLQAGLRYENVVSDFFEDGEHSMDRDYADWFPSVGLSLPVGKTQLSANYSIDIARPSFANLSDNIIYINSYSYQGGNSKLKPTYSHDISLSAAWKWIWGQAVYSRIVDDIAFENTSYSENNKLVTLIHPNNMPTFHRYTFQVFVQPTLFNVWHPTCGVVALLQDYEGMSADGSKQKLNRPIFNFIWNNLFVLPHNWRVGLDFHTQTSGDYSTYRVHSVLFTANALLRKSLFKDRLDISLQAVNLLHSHHQAVTIFSHRNLYQENMNYTRLELTATYKFNVAIDKYKGGNGDSKQRKRVK